MASPEIFNETVALAALFQAAGQIICVARQGTVNESAVSPLIRALIITDPDTVNDIYDPKRLKPGFRQISEALDPSSMKDPGNSELIKLVYNIISLSGSLSKQRAVYNRLDDCVEQLRRDVLLIHPDYESAPDNIVLDYDVIGLFSKVYSSLISPNFPKLMIYGDEQNLRRSEFQEMIRALLLSAIRACVLWNQVGGGKYSLMFKYNDIIDCARELSRP